MVNVLWIVLGVILVIVILVVVLLIVSRSKGKIKIGLTHFQFSPGDTIEGKISLNLKKPVEAKALKVGLVGIYKNTKYGRSGSGGLSRSSRSGYAFEFRQPLDGEKEYPASEKIYDFKLKIPKDLLSSRALGNNMLGTLVKSAQILSGNISSIRWYVVANLEMKGFDISKKVQVNIG
ncbi:MAG: hypothetical protein ABIH92_05060 [Nanoarchaeota archaeon]